MSIKTFNISSVWLYCHYYSLASFNACVSISDEIRKLLGVVKKDFYKFGDLLEKTQEKLDDASKQIGEASYRSKLISNKLTKVEIIPQDVSIGLLNFNGEDSGKERQI